MLSVHQPLAETGLFPVKEVMAMTDAGFATAADLLGHVPKRYEDRRRFDSFPNQPSSIPVCLRGTVVDTSSKRFGKGRGFYEAVVMDGTGGVFGSGKITCRWFNMSFIQRVVASGQEVIVHGRVKEVDGRLIIDHPEFEIVREDDERSLIHLDRIVPIYRNLSGISQRRLREIIYQAVEQSDLSPLEFACDIDSSHSKGNAVKAVHFPGAIEEAVSAKRLLALEEFFKLQLNVLWKKNRYHQLTGRVLGKKATLMRRFYESLPFDLTSAQKRSIKEILEDMRMPRPMNRLLQGDVGSGKTFVAMAAMLLAIDSGCQAALMAPTQILAEQHYLTFKKWLEPLGVRIRLKTSGRDECNHLALEGETQIVIGTHALFFDEAAFTDLGFVVIDEQHKFGVEQRAALIARGAVPDVLVMTATPIPRTLTMTIYGDLDVSLLDEKPPGRGKIITAVRVRPKQPDVVKFVKQQIAEGRQIYLVYPLVEESENLKAESAIEGFEKWQKRLSKHRVGLIHGKLKPEEKEEVMEEFRDGNLATLVATTVIEVGVDVPNASVMIIHHAERFGLAQIHQLRGRIGRGGHKGYCVLLTDGKSEAGIEKLQVLERTSDGFEIAEEDLRMRGPGDVLGTQQSGLSDLKFPEFLADPDLLREARNLANRVFSEDPQLDGKYQKLRILISQSTAGDFHSSGAA